MFKGPKKSDTLDLAWISTQAPCRREETDGSSESEKGDSNGMGEELTEF